MKPAATLPEQFLAPGKEVFLPEPLKKLRSQRGQAVANMPLPTRKTENWKYSSRHLKLSDELAATLPVSGGAAEAAAEDGYRVVIRNGVVIPEASRFPDVEGIEVSRFADLTDQQATELAERLDNTLDSKAVQLARINSARFEDGLLIRLQQDAVLDQPLFIVHETCAESAGSAYPRIYLDAGKFSKITVVEEYTSSGDQPAMTNSVAEFTLAEGARVTSVRLDIEGENVQHAGATGARLQGTGAFLDSHCIGFGGPMRRHDLQVRLESSGADCRLNGVAVTQGRQHYDNHTTIEHVAAHCNSEENYRNIASGKSHAVFNGRIHIHLDAQKSNAEMSNKNLLLTTGAEIDTKPELEIYADDVKCAHGATVGQLSEESLFYLVSRGIGRREAQILLSMAFINELIELVPVEIVREATHARLSQFFEASFEQAREHA